MFSFFRRKSTKQTSDGDGDSKKGSLRDQKTNNSLDSVPQTQNYNDDRNSQRKQQTITDDPKTTLEPNHRPLSTYDNGEEKTTENSNRNSIVRRDSKTSKEVINLLLPEDSVKYKKDTSYLSGVQNLLDIMGRGKKRNKGDKKKNSRSWSFGANRQKRDENTTDRRSVISESSDKNLNYISSNVFSNIGDVYEDALDDLKGFNEKNNNDTLTDELDVPRSATVDLIDEPTEFLKSVVGEQVFGVESERAEEEVEPLTSTGGKCAKDEIGEGGRWYFGVEDHQCGAKRDTKRPQQTCCISDPVDDPDRGTTSVESDREQEQTNVRDPAPSIPATCEFKEASVEYLSDINQNTDEAAVDSDTEFVNCYDGVLKIVEESDEPEDNKQMGTSESKQNGKNQEKGTKSDPVRIKAEDIPYPIKETISVLNHSPEKVSGFVSVCDIGNHIDEKKMATQTITTYELVSSSQENEPIVKGSLNLEIMKLEKKEETIAKFSQGYTLNGIVEKKEEATAKVSQGYSLNGVVEKKESTVDIKPKNILKDEKPIEASSSFKKHVTFHNFIEFDDGGRVEDDAVEDDESFASLDEEESEENSVFQIEVENDENPESEEENHGEIVEFVDTSSSEEDSLEEKFKRTSVTLHSSSVRRDNSLDSIANAILIEELDVENDENAGFEKGSDSDISDICVIEHNDIAKELSDKSTKECEVVCRTESSENVVIVDKKTEEESEDSESFEEEVEEEEEEDEEEEYEEEEIKEEIKDDIKIETKDVVKDVVEDEEEEEVEEEEEEEEEDEYEEGREEQLKEIECSSSDVSTSEDDIIQGHEVIVPCDRCTNDEEDNEKKVTQIYDCFRSSEKEEESAYTELLLVLEKQM